MKYANTYFKCIISNTKFLDKSKSYLFNSGFKYKYKDNSLSNKTFVSSNSSISNIAKYNKHFIYTRKPINKIFSEIIFKDYSIKT
jgi:hypothetical protein